MVKTLKEAEDRIRLAMIPRSAVGNRSFSPGIQKIRAATRPRRIA